MGPVPNGDGKLLVGQQRRVEAVERGQVARVRNHNCMSWRTKGVSFPALCVIKPRWPSIHHDFWESNQRRTIGGKGLDLEGKGRRLRAGLPVGRDLVDASVELDQDLVQEVRQRKRQATHVRKGSLISSCAPSRCRSASAGPSQRRRCTQRGTRRARRRNRSCSATPSRPARR